MRSSKSKYPEDISDSEAVCVILIVHIGISLSSLERIIFMPTIFAIKRKRMSDRAHNRYNLQAQAYTKVACLLQGLKANYF